MIYTNLIAGYVMNNPTINPPHKPVLLNEVLEYMAPRAGEVIVDGTFGAGGYTRALLGAADCRVVALDRDPYVRPTAEAIEDSYPGRFTFVPSTFSRMREALSSVGLSQVDGIVLDVGVSSMQLDTPRRGFSFQQDGPLDMRMGGDESARTAADLVNRASEEELAGIIYKFGGEHKSRRIAHAICTARASEPITRTLQLADIVRRAVGHKPHEKIDPSTRTFQAIRIWVNDELEELTHVLGAAEDLLKPGGRLVVVSFHSEEDAIVKRFLSERSGKSEGISRYQPLPAQAAPDPTFALLTRKAVMPGEQEVDENPRSRSARLRAAVRKGGAIQ